MTKSAEISEFLREQGTPSRLPEAWGSLPCDPALFDLPEDRAELLRRLLERFKRSDLLRAGVVETDPDHGVTLSRLLVTNCRYLCVLQKAGDKKPFDLMVGAGGTLSGRLPLQAALDDADFFARVEREGGRVFIAESAADVAIHRSLGLPAAPAHGVEHLAGKPLDLFCAKMGLSLIGRRASDLDATPPKSRRKRGQETGPRIPRSLILVNWQLSQLTLDDVPKMLEIRSRLLDLSERLEIPLDDFAICKPTAVQLAGLRHALECGDPQRVREALLEYYEDASVMLDRWPPIERREVDTLAAALSAMYAPQDEYQRPSEPVDPRRFEQLLDQDLIEPMLRQAANVADPFDRNLRVALAEASREYHRGTRKPRDKSVAFRDRLAAAKQILAITKELRS